MRVRALSSAGSVGGQARSGRDQAEIAPGGASRGGRTEPTPPSSPPLPPPPPAAPPSAIQTRAPAATVARARAPAESRGCAATRWEGGATSASPRRLARRGCGTRRSARWTRPLVYPAESIVAPPARSHRKIRSSDAAGGGVRKTSLQDAEAALRGAWARLAALGATGRAGGAPSSGGAEGPFNPSLRPGAGRVRGEWQVGGGVCPERRQRLKPHPPREIDDLGRLFGARSQLRRRQRRHGLAARVRRKLHALHLLLRLLGGGCRHGCLARAAAIAAIAAFASVVVGRRGESA